MKTKRCLSLFLSLIMVVSLLQIPALAANETSVDLKLTAGQLDGTSTEGILVEWYVSAGDTQISHTEISFTYDSSVLSLVDNSGKVIAIPASDAADTEIAAGQLQGYSAFNVIDTLYAHEISGNLVCASFQRAGMNNLSISEKPCLANASWHIDLVCHRNR